MIKPTKSSTIPATKLKRFSGFAGLAGTIAGNVIKQTSSQLLSGQRPSLSDSLMSVNNATAITDKLATMRGAAMKVGQLLSMDAGDLLPTHWEPVLSRLRQGADVMPQSQLTAVLIQQWGKNWYDEFKHFELRPIAAASIGQVHIAERWDGRKVAVKVQYPGVKQSIDSDIDSVAKLIKLSGALPDHVDLTPLLDKAKAQLHDEADYDKEAQYMTRFANVVADDSVFVVPQVHKDLSNDTILCMDYLSGQPLETLQSASDKDYVIKHLLRLTLKELFDARLMQSDPNFANYLFDVDTQTIQLLDFGATRDIPAPVATHYHRLAIAMFEGNRVDTQQYLSQLGLIDDTMSEPVIDVVLAACELAAEAMREDNYDIKAQQLVKRIQHITEPLVTAKEATATPDFDVALINRKVTGMILLANRLGARLNIASALAPYRLTDARKTDNRNTDQIGCTPAP